MGGAPVAVHLRHVAGVGIDGWLRLANDILEEEFDGGLAAFLLAGRSLPSLSLAGNSAVKVTKHHGAKMLKVSQTT